MNKKTLLLAGLALGCSMAVAGVGIAVGASRDASVVANASSGTYTRISATSDLTTGDKVILATEKNGAPEKGVTGGNTSGNNRDALFGTTESAWAEYTVQTSGSGWTLYDAVAGKYIGNSSNYFQYVNTGAILYSDSNGYLLTAASSGRYLGINGSNSRFYAQSNLNSYPPFRVWKITASTEKSIKITGVTADDLYLNGESYPIGFETKGFDSEPTITDVVWTVTAGGGSIEEGVWTAGPAAMSEVTLRVDLKANGVDYSASVTTKIDVVIGFAQSAPRVSFTSNDVFSVGHAFDVTYTYAEAGTLPETDPGISYRLENSDGTKIKDVILGETKFTAEDNDKLIDATYRGVDLTARYNISVLEVFENSVGAYYLVTDETELAAGDHVTFLGSYANGDDTTLFVPTTFQNNNIAGQEVALDNGAIDGKQSFTMLDFKLKDTKSSLAGSFAFEVANDAQKLGQYLYAASSGSNHLKTQESINEHARFVITIDDNSSVASIVATGSSNRNIMSPNGSNSPMLFSCYNGTATPLKENKLYLYKWVSNADTLDYFCNNRLKMSEYAGDESYNAERCAANYSVAKAAFNDLTKSQRDLFVAESGEGKAYHDAYLRLTAWATANGDVLGGANNVITAKSASMSIFGSGRDDSTMLIALGVVAVGAIATGGFMLAARKRRKEF